MEYNADREPAGREICLENPIAVQYNREYEINKKGRTERVAALSAPMQERRPPTQHKYYAPIPILLDFAFIRNIISSDLGECAVLTAVWVEILRRLFYLSRQCNSLWGAGNLCSPTG